MPESPVPSVVRWYLREWRAYRKLTQEQVAERCNTNKGQIAKLENGKQRMNDRWIDDLSRAYGIPPSYLLAPPGVMKGTELLMKLDPEDLDDVVRMASKLLKNKT